MALLTAARDHWTEFRGRRTGDKTRRTAKDLTDAFVDNVPAEEKAYAATRQAKSLDKKFKGCARSNALLRSRPPEREPARPRRRTPSSSLAAL